MNNQITRNNPPKIDTKQIKQSLSSLSNFQLESVLKSKVEKENEILIQILHLLAEVERRRLYSHKYPSLFEYCVRELKYSSGSAQRRIDTMRAMKLMPEIEEKLQTRELQMVVVSKAQSFFRQERKIGKNYDIHEKRKILSKLENKSSRECERELVAISPQSVNPERRREINDSQTELRITLNKGLVEKLDQIKSLLSNKHPHLTDQELIEVLAELALKGLDPSLKSCKSKIHLSNQITETETDTNSKSTLPAVAEEFSCDQTNWAETKRQLDSAQSKRLDLSVENPSTPTLAVGMGRNRYIPASLKAAVWKRNHGRCTFPNCGSRFKLQFDHIKPIRKGGETSFSNLRLLCQTHNLHEARRVFGEFKINRFIHSKI
jgi:hypothetical protein